ncbi:MAG: DUF488 domain-containing protein [Actinomycetaceae bacterium]|nr:DUF488 domain-containing protein [Actinomycetaceae bacterium]
MAASIYTVGYEGLDSADFVALLQKNAVQAIFDIRDTPWSRKPGFAKEDLQKILSDAGIGYVHLPSLGVPKYVRDRYHQDKNWGWFSTAYRNAIRDRKVSPDLRAIAKQAQTTRCALMCFEADHRVCHRSIVAQILQDHLGLQAVHLVAPAFDARQGTLPLFDF